GMLVIEPVPNAIGEILPLRLILEHALARPGVEFFPPKALVVFLARELQLLLHLDLHRESVGVPAGNTGDGFSAHGVEPAHQILDGPGKHVMDAGPAVAGGCPLKKHKMFPPLPRLHRLLEEFLVLPERELALLQIIRAEIGPGGKRHQGKRSTRRAMSRAREGSARLAVSMIRAMLAGSSASGRH